MDSFTNNPLHLPSRTLGPSSRTTITLFDIQVPFPFQPYPVQERYMHDVIDTLRSPGRHALLESPTGTGKTLCLLSACLAWQQRQGEKRPKILYASRTHAQLSQVARELRKTVFPSMGVSAVAVGSRDQLCIHPMSKKLTGKNLLCKCKAEVDAKACGFYNSLLATRGTAAPKLVMDIEELRAHGSRGHMCPYFMARESAKHSDLVFLPYNYLFDEEALRSLEVDVTDAIVIVDEAHNMEKVCEEVASVQLDLYDFSVAVDELRQAEILADIPTDSETPDMNAVKTLQIALGKIAAALTEAVCNSPDADRALSYRDLTGIMEKAKITRSNFRSFLTAFDAVDKIYFTAAGPAERTTQPGRSAAIALSKVRRLLVTLFEHCDSGETFARYFRAFVQSGANRHLLDDVRARQAEFALFVWCFSPALAVKALVTKHKIRNLIVTSGTLSPLATFAAALGVPMEVQLANAHVIDPKKQLLAAVVGRGPAGTALNASFRDRENIDYLNELGNVLVAVAGRVPEGLLVAFASYAQLERVVNHLEITGVLGSIRKRVFREPRETAEVAKVMGAYGEACTRGEGAALFCVARGKLSEGVDFSDSQCRGVMMVGIPFANAKDKRVAMKKEFLDFHSPRAGETWYRVDAMRAVNQTIGRVIRHKNDFGAIFLCDERFDRFRPDLSAWVKDSVTVYPVFADLERDLDRFFQSHIAAQGGLGLKRQVSELDRAMDAIVDRAMDAKKLPRLESGLSRSVRDTLAAGGAQILQCKPHEIGNPLVRKPSNAQTAGNPFAKEQQPAAANKRELKAQFQEQARKKLPASQYEVFKGNLVEFITLSSKAGSASDLSSHYRTFKRILEPYEGLLSMLLGILNPIQVLAFQNATSSTR